MEIYEEVLQPSLRLLQALERSQVAVKTLPRSNRQWTYGSSKTWQQVGQHVQSV